MNRTENIPAVLCRGLVKRFDKLTAVDHLDLEIPAGLCFGLLGPNGAGKTTTVEILEGLTPADEGRVELFGRVWSESHRREIHLRLGVMLQETEFPSKLTVIELLKIFRSFYDHGLNLNSLLESVGLTEKENYRIGKLSGGQKQRLALATALVGKPDLLFLDEPTTGLDPQARHAVWEIVEKFKAGGGTIILTTHYMEEAHRLCDRLAIMDRGKIIAADAPGALISTLGAGSIIEFTVDEKIDAELLRSIPGIESITVSDEGHYLAAAAKPEQAIPALIKTAAENGARLGDLNMRAPSLEDVFISLTGRGLRDE